MYMVEKSGKLLCRIVLIMLLFVLCFVHLVVIKRQDMHWIWQKNECGMNRILL